MTAPIHDSRELSFDAEDTLAHGAEHDVQWSAVAAEPGRPLNLLDLILLHRRDVGFVLDSPAL
jgi:hypothetical protein